MSLTDPRSSTAAARALVDPATSMPTVKLVKRYHGSCVTPCIVPSGFGVEHVLSVRCRRCPGCFAARRHLWALRCEMETLKAGRTFLFTGTFRDQPHDREVASEELTRWLYRVRKRRRGVRYFAAFERHKSGAWHLHVLAHGNDLTTRDLRTPWRAGFSNAQLADVKAARYVTKYVTKDLVISDTGRVPRIRASRDPRYGAEVMILEEELLKGVLLKPELTTDTWQNNLRAVFQAAEKNEKESLWARMESLTQSDLLMLTGNRLLDKTTGEILARR